MKAYTRSWFALMVLAVIVVGVMTLRSHPARAAGPWYVAPGGSNSNTCLSAGSPCATINGAIGKAASGDTIYVAAGTYTGVGTAVVLLSKSLTLSGGWDAAFATQGGMVTIEAQGARRGIVVNSGVTTTIERFVIQNGFFDGAFNGGGGMRNDGTLTLSNSAVISNTAINCGEGGNIYNTGALIITTSIIQNGSTVCGGGALQNSGIVTLTDSTVSGNSGVGSIDNGGGTIIFNNSALTRNTGGAFNNYNGGTLSINGSDISGNVGFGVLLQSGTLTLTNSSVHNNLDTGIYGAMDTVVTIDSSTISGNTTQYSGGGIFSYGTVTLNSTTISNNRAASGGGIYSESGTIVLQNSVLAGNTANTAPDCYGVIGSSDYNLVGDTSDCTFTPNPHDKINLEAKLGPLMGSPAYHPLSSSSSAVNAGNPAGCMGSAGLLTTDQRGATRVGPCDIGAYEYTPPDPAASVAAMGGTPQRTVPLSTFNTPLQALVLDNSGSPVTGTLVTFSAPAGGASGTFADTGVYTTTAQPDEFGVATAMTFTANSLVGSYTVTAMVSGVVTPANFLLTNILWYVFPGGNDSNDCLDPATPCATINGVLNKPDFGAGDTIRVGAGTYTGTGAEVALLDKSAILSGGWQKNGTLVLQNGISMIDGQGARRGVTINDDVTAVIEHFAIQNGSAPYGAGIYNSWRSTLTLNDSTVSGNTTSSYGGGIHSEGFTSLTFSNTIIQNNLASYGGGISSYGALALTNTVVSTNTATSYGGGLLINVINGAVAIVNTSKVIGNTGGGIVNNGALALNNSEISNNSGVGISNGGTLTATVITVRNNMGGDDGGGVSNVGVLTLNSSIVNGNSSTSRGGGIRNLGGATIHDSVISSNIASGGGIYGGGGIHNSGMMTLTTSTISRNITNAFGGGIHVDGGVLNLANSTVSGNNALRGGGIYRYSGNVKLYNVTVSDNTAATPDPLAGSQGGGLFDSSVYGSTTAQNIILAGNSNASGPDCYGPVTSAGYNLVGIVTGCTWASGAGDLLGVNPNLFPLIGSPGYHPLLPGSPAIDAGNPAGCTDNLGSPLNADQRGVARVGRCDIGAYEFDPNNNPITQIFLPLLRQSRPGISGRVTLNGIPAAGINLELRFYDGSAFSTLATMTTDSDGDYSFTGVPSLGAGQQYYVRYRNYEGTPGRLWVWGTQELTSYLADSPVEIGNFDIADIALVSPADGATVALPYTFQWTPRPATPSDIYEFDLYDPNDLDPYIYPVVGYVGSYTLSSLPAGFNVGDLYVWEIWVYSPDGGYGISYETRAVRFSNAGASSGAAALTEPLLPKPSRLLDDLPKR